MFNKRYFSIGLNILGFYTVFLVKNNCSVIKFENKIDKFKYYQRQIKSDDRKRD